MVKLLKSLSVASLLVLGAGAASAQGFDVRIGVDDDRPSRFERRMERRVMDDDVRIDRVERRRVIVEDDDDDRVVTRRVIRRNFVEPAPVVTRRVIVREARPVVNRRIIERRIVREAPVERRVIERRVVLD